MCSENDETKGETGYGFPRVGPGHGGAVANFLAAVVLVCIPCVYILFNKLVICPPG